MRLDHLLLVRKDKTKAEVLSIPSRSEITKISFLFVFNKLHASLGEHLFSQGNLVEKDGGIAQLVEHLPCKQGVIGSNPITSTNMGS